MGGLCVIGVQWGDEGKGKIVDRLASGCDMVVRYQGGGNAGHTVVVDGRRFILHLLPSGVLHPRAACVLGNGMVIDPGLFFEEIDGLAARDIRVEGRLRVSERAHVVMPYHKMLDQLREEQAGLRIGTTGRGIGPCYADKSARLGVRVADLLDAERLRARLRPILAEKNAVLEKVYGRERLEEGALVGQFAEFGRRMSPYVGDVSDEVCRALEEGKRVLFEGAQGVLLDVDFGTYPFVTSSSAGSGGIATGVGIPPRNLGEVLGVAKAYVTRVGEGPFPTELAGSDGDRLRERGEEYGSTTGRSRRCGWFDACAARWAARVNGVTRLAITKLDVLDAEPKVRVCTGYDLPGGWGDRVPADAVLLGKARPIYRDFPGWRCDTSAVRRWEDLPGPARGYLEALREIVGVPIAMVSVGKDRESVIDLEPPQSLWSRASP